MTDQPLATHPLISIRGTADVAEAAELMATCGMGALGVFTKDKEFAGILTERDVAALVGRRKDLTQLLVSEVTNDLPVVVEGPVTRSAAIAQMKRSRIRHLIVREQGDYRIVSMRDIVNSEPDLEESAEEPTAANMMTSPAVACRLDAHLEELADVLGGRDVSGMPVVDENDQLVGVISERDLAHALGSPTVRRAVRRHHNLALPLMSEGGTHVRHVMSVPSINVTPETGLTEIARLMFVNEISRVPVMREGSMVGIVTRGDVLAAVAGAHHAPAVEKPPVIVGSLTASESRPSPFDPKISQPKIHRHMRPFGGAAETKGRVR